jgi:hypothetical protein
MLAAVQLANRAYSYELYGYKWDPSPKIGVHVAGRDVYEALIWLSWNRP